MKIKTKIGLTIITSMCIVVIQGLFNLAQPEIATELAMKQFADPSLVTDTASRWYSSNSVFTAIWFSYGICVILLFTSLRKKNED